MGSTNDWVCFLVFAVGTMASLFAFFWARRLKSGELQVRSDWDFELTSIVAGGCSASAEFEVDGASIPELLNALHVQLANPKHAAQGPWAQSQKRRGELSVLRVGENGLSLSGTDLSTGEGFLQILPGERAGKLRVRYALAVPSARWLATFAQVWALGIGLTTSVILPALIFLHVGSSPNPAVRAQSLQVLQAAQVIWEPYMFLGIASSRIRMCGRYLETVIVTTAYELQIGMRSTSD